MGLRELRNIVAGKWGGMAYLEAVGRAMGMANGFINFISLWIKVASYNFFCSSVIAFPIC